MDRAFWRAVDREVWTSLHAFGFTARQRDRVWRDKPDRTEVVQVFPMRLGGMFSSLPREGQACAIELGIVLRAVPPRQDPGRADLTPSTPSSHIRTRLRRREPQLSDSPSLWYIDGERSNLAAMIEEMQRLLLTDGLAWFESYASDRYILDLMLYGNPPDVSIGSGGLHSTIRNYVAGYLAMSLGEYQHAIERLTLSAEGEDVAALREGIEAAVRRARALRDGKEVSADTVDTWIHSVSPTRAEALRRGGKNTAPGGTDTRERGVHPTGWEIGPVDMRHLIQDLGLQEYSSEVDRRYFFDYMARAAQALDGELAGEPGQAVIQRIREANWEEDEGANYLFQVDIGHGAQPIYFSYRWDDEGTIGMNFFSPPEVNAILWRLAQRQRSSRMSRAKRERFRAFVQEHGKRPGAPGEASVSDAQPIEAHDDE